MAEFDGPTATDWPDDIWFHVFCLLDWPDRCACSLVSRRLNALTRSHRAGRLPLRLPDRYSHDPTLWPTLPASITPWEQVVSSLHVSWMCTQNIPDFAGNILALIDMAPNLAHIKIGESDADDWAVDHFQAGSYWLGKGRLKQIRELLRRGGERLRSLEVYVEGSVRGGPKDELNFSSCTALTRLVVKASEEMEPLHISGLDSCTSLVHLRIHCQHYRVWLQDLPHLETVELCGVELTEEDDINEVDLYRLQPILTCQNITRLTIEAYEEIGCEAIGQLKNLVFVFLCAPELTDLRLRHNPMLETVVLGTSINNRNILEGCVQIRQLQIKTSPPALFANEIRDCTSLVDLFLAGGIDQSLEFIPEIAPNLRRVLICDWALEAPFQRSPQGYPATIPYSDLDMIIRYSDAITKSIHQPSLYPLLLCPNLVNVAAGEIGEYAEMRMIDWDNPSDCTSIFQYRIMENRIPHNSDPHQSAMCLRHIDNFSELPDVPLLPIKNLVEISISESGFKDISALSSCSRLTRLEIDMCDDISNMDAIGDCTELRILSVENCPVFDFSFIEKCMKLSEIQIYIGNVMSNMCGNPPLNLGNQWPASVKNVQFGWCLGLHNISALSHCVYLERLWIIECPALHDLEPIRSLRHLYELRLEGESSLNPCSIGDWSAVTDHPSLRTVVIESVLEGPRWMPPAKSRDEEDASLDNEVDRYASRRIMKRWPAVPWHKGIRVRY